MSLTSGDGTTPSKAEEIRHALDSLTDDAKRTLAAVASASLQLTGIILRSLGPGTLKVLEVNGLIEPLASRRGRGVQLTDFGREVAEAAADILANPGTLLGSGKAVTDLDDAYARFLDPQLDDSVAVAIDIGHYQVRIGIGLRSGEILDRASFDVDVDKQRAPTLDAAVKRSATLLQDYGIESHRVVGVGLGIPGPIDAETAMVANRPSSGGHYLQDWENVDVAAITAAKFEGQLGRPVPVSIENDANLCVLGEARFGAAQGFQHVLLVKMSAGIGAGLYLDGALYRGAHGLAGEFGHTPVAYPTAYGGRERRQQPARCSRCGQIGCLEVLAGGVAIVDSLSPDAWVSLQEIAKGAAYDDRVALAIRQAAGHVGAAIAGAMLFLDPEVVLVAGVLALAEEHVLEPIRAQVAERVGPAAAERVHLAEHKDDAAVYGGLALAFERGQALEAGPTPTPTPQ